MMTAASGYRAQSLLRCIVHAIPKLTESYAVGVMPSSFLRQGNGNHGEVPVMLDREEPQEGDEAAAASRFSSFPHLWQQTSP